MGSHEVGAAMMERPKACPACGGSGLIMSGHACCRQRWRCKGCGRQFTRITPRGKPAALQACMREASRVVLEGLEFGSEAKIVGWPNSALTKRGFSRPAPAR